MQVVRRKLSGAADGTTAGSKTAFNHAMLDLFGSIIWYEERSPKMHQCESIIMVLCSQTWHGGPYTCIQAVFGYDTSNFLMALSRFVSTCIGVWPEEIDSDRGSQLVGAERELKEAWKKIDWKSLQRSSAQNDRINLGIWSC